MILKIGRYKYQITKKDQFMDNGACIQLLSQSQEPSHWGHRASPILSQKAIKQIESYRMIPRENKYTESPNVEIFSLDI